MIETSESEKIDISEQEQVDFRQLMKDKKLDVKSFWNSNPCDGQWDNIEQHLKFRYRKEPWLKDFVKNDFIVGKNILDVGCGQGLDIYIYAKKNCRNVVGIDLSEESVGITKKMIRKYKLDNANAMIEDAENLKFDANTFDTVCSNGVLHHIQNTEKAVSEIYRVLKEQGTTIILLYRKYSIKGLIAILLRLLSKIIDKITAENNFIYNQLYEKTYFKKNNQLGTLLLELFGCPIMKMYTKKQIKKLFKDFNKVRIKCFSTGFIQVINLLPNENRLNFWFKKIDNKIESIFGFYWVIEAIK